MTTTTGSINLAKGQPINLSKTNPTVDEYTVGAGWDVNRNPTAAAYDIDLSALVLDVNGKLVDGEKGVLFYNQKEILAGALKHSGDNKDGAGDGDDESAFVTISKLPPAAEKVLFVVTMHNGVANGQNFGQVGNAHVRILDTKGNAELAKADLAEDFSGETVIEFAELYKKDGEWRFKSNAGPFRLANGATAKTFAEVVEFFGLEAKNA